MDKDNDMDKDTDKGTNKHTDTDMDMDTDKDMDKDTDTDMELEFFCKTSIRRYSCYSSVWITCDTSWRKFPWYYTCKLVVPPPDENYDMHIFKNLCRRWNCSPNDVLAELEISV